MNRRKKFYSNLEYDLEEYDYYDDDYEEDEDNEYYYHNYRRDDNNNKKGAGCKEAASGHTALGAAKGGLTKAATPPNEDGVPFAEGSQAVSPQDMDYELITTLLPAFQQKWAEVFTAQGVSLEHTQCDVVEVLRDSNYDVDEAILALQQKIAEKALEKETREKPPFSVNDETQKTALGGTSTSPATKKGRTLKLGQDNKTTVTPTANNAKTIAENPPVVSKIANATRETLLQEGKSLLRVVPDESKKDCTFVIAGHVDAGKSTTLGHLLFLLGKISQAEVDNNEKNARVMHKESFKYAWLLDQSEEERRRGITIDAGSYSFETEHRRIHVLDAPGHKDYLVGMISSATQADAALLVVTAATSEFDVGLSHGTKDHLCVLKILGVRHFVVAVNKMDTVNFSQERYNYVVQNLTHLLKQVGYTEAANVGFCPISGMSGSNILHVDNEAMPWYDGPSLLELLDKCPVREHSPEAPLRLSLQDVQGTRLYCKVESGRLQKASKVLFLPSSVDVNVKSIVKSTTGGLVDVAFAGDCVEIDSRVPPVGLSPGHVGCLSTSVIRCSKDFQARVQTLTSLENSIIPGAIFTMVVHALSVPVEVVALVSKMDRQGRWSKGMVKCIPKATQALIIFRASHKIALEPADMCRALGCFVLMQNGVVVAGGLVEKMML